MRRFLSIVGSLLLMVLFVQGKVLAKDNTVLAKVGDINITVSDFNKIIGYFDSEKQKIIETNPQLKETILRQYIQTIVISTLAKEKGFDKNKGIKEQIEFFKDSFLSNEFLKKEVANKITISEDDLKSYYDTHQDEFKIPEMVRARHILVRIDTSASESDKKKAKEKAKDILKKIKSGEDFAKLASELSDDPVTKPKGGDLGFFPRGRMIKPFEDTAFSLKPEEISGIVETQFGYHIIRVEEKKDPTIEKFDTAKNAINQKLLQDRTKSKVTEFIEKAMKDSKVEIHPEVLHTGNK